MSVAETPSAAEVFRYCRDVTRQRARNFYYGLKLLPQPQRSSMYAIYAWMRRADDITDDARDDAGEDGVPHAQTRARLDEFRRVTHAALGGETENGDPVLMGLRASALLHGLDPAPFDAMLAGQLDDLDGRRYETFDELREYCERVASSVGHVCIQVWGYDDARAPAQATARGIAFQLTNILRDFVEDHVAGRTYLPAEDFARHGITPAMLRRWADPERCEAFLMEQIDRAESFYERSAPLDDLISPACRPALWAMTAIYHGLLDRLRADPTQVVLDPPVRLTALSKGTIALRARLRARSARRRR